MITTTSPAADTPPRERAVPDRDARIGARMLTLPWHRLALGAVLALAAVLNVWALDREGYANSYYAAAVRSMLESWHNFFFVSFDPGGFVSIDKPPLGFWIETASARLFGFSGVSLLLPEALAGVLACAVLYRLVACAWGRGAGLLAALALAVTPVSVITSRNNTIDSLLVLTVLLGAWSCLRAAATGRLRWLLLCAVLVGLGFNIKMLEAYLVVPAFGLVYLLGSPLRWPKRIAHLTLAAVVLLGVSLFWAVAVDLTPASARPYVGSSGTNSELNLAFGYNGLQRLTGQLFGHGGSGGGAPAGGGAGGAGGMNALFNGGPAGLFRLLGTTLGGQVSWLLVLAVLGLAVAATVVPWRRLDERGRSLLLWSGWLATAGAFFSVAEFFHPYYTVMLAPAIAALAAIGVTALWRAYRAGNWRGWLLPAVLLASAAAQAYLLRDYPAWSRWLTPLVVGAGLLAALALVALRLRLRRAMRAPLVAAGIAVAALLATPATWAAYTVAHAEAINATIPTAGPSATGTSGNSRGGFGGPTGGGFGPPSGSGVPGTGGTGNGNGTLGGSGSRATGSGTSGAPGAGASGGAAGGPAGGTGTGSANGSSPGSPNGSPPSGTSGGSSSGASSGAFGGGMPGAPGGPGGDMGSQANTALIKYLEAHQGTAKYLVATTSSQSAAPIIIATGKPVMALGGFSGSDQILTASQLAALVKAGTVRYFLIQSGGPGMGSAPSGSASSGSGAAGSSSATGTSGTSATTGTSGTRNGAASTNSASGGNAPRTGGMPGGPGGNSALTQWVTAHCTIVPSIAYQTSSTTTSSGFGQGGTLYVCNSTSTTSK